MPSAALHDLPDSLVTEGFICAKRAFLVLGAFKLALEPLEEPADFQIYARIYKGVEMATGVFESEGVWVVEERGDVHV